MHKATTFLFSAAALSAVAVAPAVAFAKPAAMASSVKPRLSLCEPVAVETVHGTRMEAYCRLARIEHGNVSCVQVDTAKATTCRFLPRSGRWLESTSGDTFAVAGQPISRNGKPGGRYIVASKLSKDGRPPCAKPKSKPTARAADEAGTSTGVPMGGACTIEVNNSPYNAHGRPMQNYATREVCTSSYPHPDGATLVRRPSPGVYCYTGLGAALNDQSARERDANGHYLPGPEACHVSWTAPPAQGGKEYFAAKRPNAVAYPLPGHVVTNSPIVWRPYYRYTPIAN
jgi:hypothetical protein